MVVSATIATNSGWPHSRISPSGSMPQYAVMKIAGAAKNRATGASSGRSARPIAARLTVHRPSPIANGIAFHHCCENLTSVLDASYAELSFG
jgi:hypothetical protein